MAEWKLIAIDVKLVHQIPSYTEYNANIYECSNCHNRLNDIDGLPPKCPWCGEKMKEVES